MDNKLNKMILIFQFYVNEIDRFLTKNDIKIYFKRDSFRDENEFRSLTMASCVKSLLPIIIIQKQRIHEAINKTMLEESK